MVKITRVDMGKATLEVTKEGLVSRDFIMGDDEVEEKFNPHHVPAGSPEGGQFTTSPGGSAASAVSVSGGEFGFSTGRVVGEIRLPNGDVIDIAASNKIITIFEQTGRSTDTYVDDINTALEGIDPEHLEGIRVVALTTTENYAGQYEVDYLVHDDGRLDITTGVLRLSVMRVSGSEMSRAEVIRLGKHKVDYVFKHEVGHNVWLRHLTDEQRASYAKFGGLTADLGVGEDVELGLLTFNSYQATGGFGAPRARNISKYGNTNLQESFAESYTGINSLTGEVDKGSLFTLNNDNKPTALSFEDIDTVLKEISQW